MTYLIAVLCEHPVFQGFPYTFSPSLVHSALPSPMPAPCLFLFIYSEQFFFLGMHVGPVLYIVSLVLPFISLLPFVLSLPICGLFVFCIELVA